MLPWMEAPTRAVARLAGPMILSMLSYSAMTLVGTLFVVRLGPASLAAVGLSGSVLFALLCFPIGLFGGAKLFISQATGSADPASARGYFTIGIVTALIVRWGLGVRWPRSRR